MKRNFDFWDFWCYSICIIFAFILIVILLNFLANFIKKDLICDNEKQSKFILECIKTDTTSTSICEQTSRRLYCK